MNVQKSINNKTCLSIILKRHLIEPSILPISNPIKKQIQNILSTETGMMKSQFSYQKPDLIKTSLLCGFDSLPGLLLCAGLGDLEALVDDAQPSKSCLLQVRPVVVIPNLST
ncbi:hypothetical protein QJS10_CPB18g00885 [Acorus calamus]|uniref:Uncharacterized protein n=1 Tax=Acorus calamus TaxID=4465 RepID=A0AAV9CRI3_ACOCL|nr:hypothetical protein QJS10_CPB18g00885 [Acorus calamus]